MSNKKAIQKAAQDSMEAKVMDIVIDTDKAISKRLDLLCDLTHVDRDHIEQHLRQKYHITLSDFPSFSPRFIH